MGFNFLTMEHLISLRVPRHVVRSMCQFGVLFCLSICDGTHFHPLLQRVSLTLIRYNATWILIIFTYFSKKKKNYLYFFFFFFWRINYLNFSLAHTHLIFIFYFFYYKDIGYIKWYFTKITPIILKVKIVK